MQLIIVLEFTPNPTILSLHLQSPSPLPTAAAAGSRIAPREAARLLRRGGCTARLLRRGGRAARSCRLRRPCSARRTACSAAAPPCRSAAAVDRRAASLAAANEEEDEKMLMFNIEKYYFNIFKLLFQHFRNGCSIFFEILLQHFF